MVSVTTSRKPRADRGDGSIKQITNGRGKGNWRVRLTYRDKWNRKQSVDKQFETQKEAKAFLKQFKQDIEKGKQNEKGYTLGEWFDWLKENDWPTSVRQNTISYRTFRFEKYTRPILGDMPLPMLRPMMVRDFYTEIEKLGAGKHTVEAVKTDLVGMINKAISFEVFDGSNPFSVIRIEAPTLREGTALTPTQAKYGLLRMAAAVRRGELAEWPLVFVTIALCTGLRRGELLALDESQFDFAQALITVDRALIVHGDGKQEIGLPKKDKVRSVVLSKQLATWVQTYLKTADRRGSTLLFPSETGKPLMVRRLRDHWARARTAAKFPSSMVPHDCRLTHNNWIEKLMPQVSDSTRLAHMGHSASGVNLRYYTRELTPAMDELRKGIDGLIVSTRKSKVTA
jgi:integrase